MFFEKNSTSIKQLINQVEECPEVLEKFIGKGIDRIKERYNWKRIISLYSNVFRETMK